MDKYNNLALRNIGKIDFTRIKNEYIEQSIDFKAYKKQKLEHLDQDLSTKIKIYLDLKYIIKIRDSILKKNSSINKRIFFRLKELVNDGKVICPFSENVLDEILKQSNLKTRNRTAQILDILSKNISLKSLQYILINEFKNILMFCNGQELEKVNYWDYPISVIGDIDFKISNNIIEKDLVKILFYEGLITTTIQELVLFYKNIKCTIISSIAEKCFRSISYDANGLSMDKIINNQLHDYFISMGKEFEISPEILLKKIENCNTKDIERIAPCTYVFCSLHSEMIKDSSKKYKKNDYYDIIHCCLAIPTCDYFFTEDGFMHRVKNVLKMDKKFNVKIESKPENIIKLLDKI